MKIRPSVLLGAMAIVGALLVLGLWSSKRSHPTAAAPEETAASPGEIPKPADESVVAAVPQSQPRPTGNEGPIVFYGRLVDQTSAPVAEADIIGTTLSHNGHSAQFSTRSGDDGFFKLDAGNGESVKFIPQRQGYALASTNNVEFYSHLKAVPPDPNKPVIIKMWKLQGAELLATFNGRYRLNATDTPAYFDFVAQTFVPTNGDIKITIKPPTDALLPVEQQDWSVEIETADGGLMEVTPGDWATTFWAPVDGYQQKLVLHPSANAQDAGALFFVQTRQGGIYTKLSLKIGINRDANDPLDFVIYGVANTNGSCNWEGDPGL